MRQVIFELFGVPVHGYGLMIVIGFLLALFVTTRIARRAGLPEVFYDLGMVMLLAGILGGRTFYYVENYSSQFAERPFWDFFKIWEGGLVFYGGAVGGLLGGLAYLYWKRLPVLPVLDVASIGIPIGMAFGRLGCFLNGCCFGRICDDTFPLGVRFPQDVAPYDHQVRLGWIEPGGPMLPVHPVQLYQAVHDFALFGLLWWAVGRGHLPRGAALPLLWVLYGFGRFFVEGLRADNAATFSGLTISQNVSIVTVAVFGVVLGWVYAYRWRQGARPTSPAA